VEGQVCDRGAVQTATAGPAVQFVASTPVMRAAQTSQRPLRLSYQTTVSPETTGLI
jgi:hypothetical protein